MRGCISPLARIIRRAVKGAVFLRVPVPPGEVSVHPRSYRGGEKGNPLAEALGTWVRHGRIGKPTGRNTCEARAGLERDDASADRPQSPGRPLDAVRGTDRGGRGRSPG